MLRYIYIYIYIERERERERESERERERERRERGRGREGGGGGEVAVDFFLKKLTQSSPHKTIIGSLTGHGRASLHSIHIS